jgi:pSer/pThr/pTyr-binding forkhead associated (FHA) protein
MTSADVRERLRAEARERPFLLFSDGFGRRRVVELDGRRLTIGRRVSSDVALTWDHEVSRLHVELVQMGSDWVACDEGLSHNGTFVNGARLRGRQRLREGDVLAVGATRIEFCQATGRSTAPPTRAASAAETVQLTPSQRRVLEVLCRPLRESAYAPPASNRDIAAELYLSVETVKGTLSTLFERFGLTALPQNAKRAMLASRALDQLDR